MGTLSSHKLYHQHPSAGLPEEPLNSRLRVMSTPRSKQTFLFQDTIWLGGNHDGLPLMSFENYAKRLLSASQPGNYAARVQCVFTFGLLEGNLEVKVPEAKLLFRLENGTTMMTCEHLPALLKDWRDRIMRLGDSQACREWAQRSTSALRLARGIMQLEIFQVSESPLFRCGIDKHEIAAIFSTIACIAEAVRKSGALFSHYVGSYALGLGWTFARDLIGHTKELVVSNGWCPFLVRTVQGACSLQYVSMRTPLLGRRMYSHDSCTEHEGRNADTFYAQCGRKDINFSVSTNQLLWGGKRLIPEHA
jgi:hypothetical protein